MNRRRFFGVLAGVLVLPAAAIAALRGPCRDGKHPNWCLSMQRCPDCGMTLKDFWLKKFGPPKKGHYKRTDHVTTYRGRTIAFSSFEWVDE